MLVSSSIEAVNSACGGDGMVTPLYRSFCFSNIAGTILDLFAVPHGLTSLPKECTPAHRPKKVVFLFLDGFGWSAYERVRGSTKLLRLLEADGLESKLTALFPSNTAPSVTAINTGLTASESGIIEWLYYEPLLGESFFPLLFSTLDSQERESLARRGVDPAVLFPFRTIYQRLNEHGVASKVVQPAGFTPSSYSSAVFDGGNFVPYHALVEGLFLLGDEIKNAAGPAYFYFYYDGFDSLMHSHMPGSRYVNAEIELFFEAFDRILLQNGTLNDTLVIIGADHGQMGAPIENAIYVNQLLPELTRWLSLSPSGRPILPSGGPRDMYLHIQPEYRASALDALKSALGDKAKVCPTEEIYQLFGSRIENRFLERAPDLAILPLRDECIWWYEPPKLRMKHAGHHGGLTPAEMEIPFCALQL